MIQTTSDLRLGNWLYESDKSKFPMQVESIGKNWIYLDFEGNEGDVFENSDKEIYPIPLTKKLYTKLKIEKYWGKVFHFEDIDGAIFDTGVKYVHELQNLYYALTGNELKIEREWL